MSLPRELLELSDLLYSLPGIGPKLSQRLALYLSTRNKTKAVHVAEKLTQLVEKISDCDRCGNVATSKYCLVCENTARDKTIIWIVEDALDLYNIELAGEYNGLYHVLHGVISPVNGVGPDDLNIKSLVARVQKDNVKEVILGLNPNVEGESTSLYIKSELEAVKKDLIISQLAKGLPSGSDIEFISHQTIVESFKRREQM